MEIRKHITVLLVVCLFGYPAMAQEMPSVVPPAPEAASLGKYTDMPVNYSSGLPQISIPMFTASSRDISVPVSLSYHAGGIRVEEIASRVGLGWNLQAGGSITRSVRGVADDKGNGWLNTSVSVQDFKDAPYDIAGNIDRETMLRDAIDLNNDFEPDVFNFSYPGGGGKFYLKPNGDVMLVPNTEHKITYTTGIGGIQSFVVTDPSGYKYYFGEYIISVSETEVAREESSVTTSFTDINDNTPVGVPPTKSATHATSWHLIAIESPLSQGKVIFRYSLQQTKSLNRASQNQKRVSSGSCSVPSFVTTYIYAENDEMVLDEIEFANGTIDFVYEGNDRQDLQGGKALDKVILKDKEGIQVRAFDLVHNYFVSAGSPAAPNSNIFSDHLKKRLYLDKVEETGIPGSTAKVYELEYETSFTNLPDRFSEAQDVWGFYNGKDGNLHLIPTHFGNDAIVHSTTGNSAYQVIGGADRRVDFDYAKANTLKKITYPTGGSASFEYESNGAYLADNQTRIANTYFQTQKSNKAYFNYQSGQSPAMAKTATINFTVDEDDLSGTLYFYREVTGCPGGFSVCGMSVLLEGVGHSYSRNLSDPGTSDIYFNVAPGDYKLTVTVTEDVDHSPTSATALLSSFINPNAYKDRSEYNVGGLRILRTRLDDAINGMIVREYSYVTDINTASGFLENNKWTFYEQDVSVCSSGPSSSEMQSSQSSAVSMGTGGGHIGYKAVREAQLPGDVPHTGPSGTEYPNGYTAYEFDYVLSTPNQSYAQGTDQAYELIFGSALTRPSSSEFPYAPFKHKTWKRGNMLSSSTYKNTGRFSELLNKQENQYSDSDCLGDVMYDAIQAMRADQRGEVGVWAFYEVVTGNHHVINSRTTQVQSNGTIIENSAHSYTNHFLRPDKSTVSHSDGQKTISKIKYTDDSFGAELSNSEKTVIANMAAENILAPVLTETFIDSEATPDAKNLTVYQNSSGKYRQISTKIWNRGTSVYEERLTYSYDGFGNYKVVSKDGAQHMAYIWDYNGLFPIAQVAKANGNYDIAYTSFESDGKGNWSFSGLPASDSKLPSGGKYYKLGSGNITNNLIIPDKKYILSFWSRGDGTGTDNVKVNDVVKASHTDTAWKYHRVILDGLSTTTISGTAEIDELRLYPFGAQMTTYTYDPHRGVTTMGSANNLFTYYRYDDFGRLYKILDHDHNIVKMVDYVYNQSINN